MSTIFETIIEGVWAVIDGVLSAFSNILPSVDPTNMPFKESIDLVMDTGYQFGFIIPFNVLFLCLSVIITWELITFGIKFVKWVIERVVDVIPL